MTITYSGTVGTYRFNQQKVIDHAARRAGLSAEQLSAEQVQIAQDLIFTITSQWASAGFPLWTRQYLLLGMTQNSPFVNCPVGTLDVFHTYWRQLNPWRGNAVASSGGNVSQLFGGQANSDVTITGTNPGVIAQFGNLTEVDTIGVLLGGASPLTAVLNILTSSDGVSFTQFQALPLTTYTPGQWAYFDLAPVPIANFIQIQYTGGASITLNQLNFGLANGVDTEIGALNIDDYYNLPDRSMLGDRPNSGYVDRQIVNPVLAVWPAPNSTAFYNGTVTALVRRYIQDPGSLTNSIEVRQNWLEALIWRLANLMIYELPDPDAGSQSQASYFTLMAKQNRIQNIGQEATKAEALAWSEERTRAPIRWAPNISPYTK